VISGACSTSSTVEALYVVFSSSLVSHHNFNLRDEPTINSTTVVDVCHDAATLHRWSYFVGPFPIFFSSSYMYMYNFVLEPYKLDNGILAGDEIRHEQSETPLDQKRLFRL